MQIGLAGLPLGGKTTLFNLLTDSNYDTGFGGPGEIHAGSAVVPDYRIDFLADIYKPEKTIYAQIQFTDIPGVSSAGGSAGLAAKLLEEVRASDVLVQVVRAFDAEDITAVAGPVTPFREVNDFSAELILADMAAMEKRAERIKNAKKLTKESQSQLLVLEKLIKALEEEQPVSSVRLDDNERKLVADQTFLSEKPLILVVNTGEEQLRSGTYPDREKVMAYAANMPVAEVCALTEMEINQLSPAERGEFMADLGLKEPGIERLAKAAYRSLGLISFFTVGDDEVRAWPIRRGTVARKAAGKVHSDIERGFIRAEVFHYDHIREHGSVARLREKGLFRLEGKEYVVKDGDIISYRFNV